jgi:hypothetical protein
MSVIKPSQFNPASLKFSSVRVNPTTQAKSVYINYNDGPLLVQCPKMALPFGLNVSEFDGSPKKFGLALSFKNMDDTEVRALHNMIQSIERMLIEHATTSSVEFFKKPLKSEIIREFFNAGIKQSKDKATGLPDGKYPDTMSIKLDVGGKNATEVYNEKRELDQRPFESIFQKGGSCVALITCSCWISAGKFGITWRAKQIKYYPIAGLSGYSIMDDDEVDAVSSAISSSLAVSGGASAAAAAVEIADDDDTPAAAAVDEDDDEEEEAPPVKVPITRKKPAAKK